MSLVLTPCNIVSWGLIVQSSFCAERMVRVLLAGTLSEPSSKQTAPWPALGDVVLSLLSTGEAAAGVLRPAHER